MVRGTRSPMPEPGADVGVNTAPPGGSEKDEDYDMEAALEEAFEAARDEEVEKAKSPASTELPQVGGSEDGERMEMA